MISDKLSIQRLPLYQTPLAQPVTDLGRIVSQAGELTQVANGSAIRFIAYVEFARQDVVRANHYHEARVEWLYLMTGRLSGRFIDLDTNTMVEQELEAGHLVQVHPRCAHAYRALERVQAIEFADLPYDERDTVPYVLL